MAPRTKHNESPSPDLGKSFPDLPDSLRESLNRLIDYLWDDELNDFRAAMTCQNSAGGLVEASDDHIFRHLVSLKAWLEARQLQSESYIEDSEPQRDDF